MAGPKPSEAGKYNIRNMAKPVLLKKASKVEPAKQVDFAIGDRIKSDFFGPGTISGIRVAAGRQVYDVKFDSGRSGTFAKDKASFVKL
jgi:hypothetical protein